MVYGSPPIRISRPMTPGSALYRFSHVPKVSTISWSRPTACSSGLKNRPSRGWRFSSAKKSEVTCNPALRTGALSSPMVELNH